MLDGKANGCSQWFLFYQSVASGLEKPLLTGYLIVYSSVCLLLSVIIIIIIIITIIIIIRINVFIDH